ncbi:MAG: hypothetical protein IH884_14590 [Myxococcales bacterium]|nr:hypothetical protein [Myxococcales bacterium]
MKRRALSLFLILFAVWPLIQYGLVRAYDVDPWKLMGFAMYCVPGPMKTVRVYEISSDGSQRMLDFMAYNDQEQRIVDRFRELRRALGDLQPSDELAEAMLALHPDFEGVVVSVLSLKLDPESARLEPEVKTDTHWRDGRDEPFIFPTSDANTVGERMPG